jgi:hypothetical protein
LTIEWNGMVSAAIGLLSCFFSAPFFSLIFGMQR